MRLEQLFNIELVAEHMATQFPQTTRGPKKDWAKLAAKYRDLVVQSATKAPGPNKFYFLPVDTIRKQLMNYQVNGKRFNWPQWFEQQSYSIYSRIEQGNNLKEQQTMIQFNYDHMSAEELENSFKNEEILNDFQVKHSAKLEDQLDFIISTPIDTNSLSNYIASTLASLKNKTRLFQGKMIPMSARLASTYERNATTAQKILALVNERGELEQTTYASPFGRYYMRGNYNLQSATKIVRHAALGDCHLVDIQASAFAWRKYVATQLYPQLTLPATTTLLQDRTAFRNRIARLLNCDVEIVKQIITSIGFGADLNARAWPTGHDGYEIPAVRKLLGYTGYDVEEQLAKLQNDPDFSMFIEEQKLIAKIIITHFKDTVAKADYPDCVKDRSGRLNENKLMAYLYQQTETDWLMQLVGHLKAKGHDILLLVHDAIYVRAKPNMQELQSVLTDSRGNMIDIKIDVEEIRSYVYVDIEEERRHKQFIADEERRAQQLLGN
jgi:hypothetical protein